MLKKVLSHGSPISLGCTSYASATSRTVVPGFSDASAISRRSLIDLRRRLGSGFRSAPSNFDTHTTSSARQSLGGLDVSDVCFSGHLSPLSLQAEEDRFRPELDHHISPLWAW